MVLASWRSNNFLQPSDFEKRLEYIFFNFHGWTTNGWENNHAANFWTFLTFNQVIYQKGVGKSHAQKTIGLYLKCQSDFGFT